MQDSKACGFHCIKANDISVKIGNEIILENINLHIHCGELTVIIGPNGAGKTTLLKTLLGEIKHNGEIRFVDKKDNKPQNLKIGYVPQKLNIEKGTPLTVYELFASLTTNKPVWIIQKKNDFIQITDALEKFGAGGLVTKKVGDLSGGELQRVLLAIATHPTPNLLILDEPVSGIDRNGIKTFFEQINMLKKEYDMSIILVSHDLDLVQKYADNVVLLNKNIKTQGKPESVFSSKEFKEVFK